MSRYQTSRPEVAERISEARRRLGLGVDLRGVGEALLAASLPFVCACCGGQMLGTPQVSIKDRLWRHYHHGCQPRSRRG